MDVRKPHIVEGNVNQLDNVRLANELVYSNVQCVPKNKLKSNLYTWRNYNGTVSRQIDYFAISKLYKSWVVKIGNINSANTRHRMQHKMLKMKLMA